MSPPIDLRTCKPGQKLKTRDGEIMVYVRHFGEGAIHPHELMECRTFLKKSYTDKGHVFSSSDVGGIYRQDYIVEILSLPQYGWNSPTAQEIRDALEAAKVSQRELARRMGVGERTARRWCEGVQQPRSMLAIKRALGLACLLLAVLLSGCGRERIEIDGQQIACRKVSPQQVAKWEAWAKRNAEHQRGMRP